MKAVAILHLCAENDHLGNPQRCYVVLGENNRFLGAYDEGYGAHYTLPVEIRDLAKCALCISCTVEVYEEFLAWSDQLLEDFIADQQLDTIYRYGKPYRVS